MRRCRQRSKRCHKMDWPDAVDAEGGSIEVHHEHTLEQGLVLAILQSNELLQVTVVSLK